MLVSHKFFSKISDIQYFKNNNFLTKTRRCPLCWLLWIQKRILSLKLPDNWQISEKQNHIFQKSKSHEISSTDVHVGEDLEFIIRVFSWCIPLDHEIYTKWKKTKHLTWLKLYLVIISALEIKVNKHKNIHLSFSTKNFCFSQNSSVPFHQLTFYRSISCVLLIDKQNESW